MDLRSSSRFHSLAPSLGVVPLLSLSTSWSQQLCDEIEETTELASFSSSVVVLHGAVIESVDRASASPSRMVSAHLKGERRRSGAFKFKWPVHVLGISRSTQDEKSMTCTGLSGTNLALLIVFPLV
jgi:hypothetical protein